MAEFESSDDRLKYLTDHGIEVETPEDRKKGSNIDTRLFSQLSSVDLSSQGGVEFALVPQDTSKPIRKMYLPSELASKAGDQLPSFVKAYFADGVAVDAGLLEGQATKQFASGQLKGMDQSVVSRNEENGEKRPVMRCYICV